MIREEKQRQLDAVRAELSANEDRLAELTREYAILHAWLDGYDEGIAAGEADAIETIFPPPEEMPFPLPSADKTIAGSEHVERQVLEVLSTRQMSLEQLRRSFGWSHFETDNAVARLWATKQIMLGKGGYHRPMPGDKSFVGSADESPGLSNGDASS